MMNTKKNAFLLIALYLITLFAGCSQNPASIEVEENTETMGNTYQHRATWDEGIKIPNVQTNVFSSVGEGVMTGDWEGGAWGYVYKTWEVHGLPSVHQTGIIYWLITSGQPSDISDGNREAGNGSIGVEIVHSGFYEYDYGSTDPQRNRIIRKIGDIPYEVSVENPLIDVRLIEGNQDIIYSTTREVVYRNRKNQFSIVPGIKTVVGLIPKANKVGAVVSTFDGLLGFGDMFSTAIEESNDNYLTYDQDLEGNSNRFGNGVAFRGTQFSAKCNLSRPKERFKYTVVPFAPYDQGIAMGERKIQHYLEFDVVFGGNKEKITFERTRSYRYSGNNGYYVPSVKIKKFSDNPYANWNTRVNEPLKVNVEATNCSHIALFVNNRWKSTVEYSGDWENEKWDGVLEWVPDATYAGRNVEIKVVGRNGRESDNLTWTHDDAFNIEIRKNYNVVLYGDVNGDGQIDSNDYILLQRYILDHEVENFNKQAADLNGDGYIDSTDLVLLRRYILEMIDEFPVERM
ncbi:dockerin type I repeat-containing protein [Chitinispirillales bacterium ANBcel5]|uniref:dockerin type I repeat-containing protein n=1 Tax=Cellulosispirillum alkaliphilum TaxID=3039283 RepID=UPI002A5382EB|nr:dockerin type I repeat-containing protein [Chitinispirillales bacterium ANBcel5]